MNPDKLFEIIGKVTVENFLLKEEIIRLKNEIKDSANEEKEDNN